MTYKKFHVEQWDWVAIQIKKTPLLMQNLLHQADSFYNKKESHKTQACQT